MAARLPAPGDPRALYLLDLSCFIYRFFATVQRGAAQCFIEFVAKVMRTQRPAFFAVCTDTPWPTFRHELAPKRDDKTGYKAQRPPPDVNLLEQIRHAKELLEDVFGLPIYARKGFEADDLIATLAQQAQAEGMKVVILAHDKDLMQLVNDECVLWDGKGRVTGPDEVVEKFGVRPDQLGDYLAIVGDSADNVPGLRGAGPKAAVEILGEHQTLAYALDLAGSSYSSPFFQRRPRYREMLRTEREAVLLSKKLVTLADNVPIDWNLEELRFSP